MVHMEAWLNKVDEIAAEGPSYKLGHDSALVLVFADGQEVVYMPPAAPTFSVVGEMLQITYEEEVKSQ